MARMSAVVSVMMISITRVMETTGINWKVGAPNSKGTVIPTHAASATLPKSAMPSTAAMMVPMTSPSRMAILLRKPPKKPPKTRVITRISTSVKNANPMFPGLANSGASGTPPADQRIATGIREIAIMVMIEPVTTGGKKRSSRPKNGAASTVRSPATITDP